MKEKKAMMWTKEKIRNLCVEYCGKCGVEFTAPILINARMTNTLGLCHATYDKEDGWMPTMIEFSRQLLTCCTDDSIEKVIGHECAHYITFALTHEDHGHDSIFKHYCSIIGIPNDGIATEVEYTVSYDKLYKYTFYCKECGEFLGGHARTCDMVKNVNHYHSNCCNANLILKKNW